MSIGLNMTFIYRQIDIYLRKNDIQ